MPGIGIGAEGDPERNQALDSAKFFSGSHAAGVYRTPSACGREAKCFLRPLPWRSSLGSGELPMP